MVVVLSIVVIVLCTRVVSFDSYDWLDLPELVSIYMEYDAFRFNDDSWDTLIMRSDERRMDWWSRFAEIDDSDWQSVQELHIQVSSSSCSWEWFLVVRVKTRHAQFDSYWNAWLWVWLQEWCYDCWRWVIRVVLMSRHLCSSWFLQLIVVREIEVALFFVVFVLMISWFAFILIQTLNSLWRLAHDQTLPITPHTINYHRISTNSQLISVFIN